jgi:hypothetical protein
MKSYIYNDTSMDIESLEAFTDRFFEEVISPLGSKNLVSVSLGLVYHCHVFMSSPIMLKNNVQCLHLLKHKVLSSPLASHIRINEDIHNVKCYFHYTIF